MGGRSAVWLVLLVEECCYSLQVAVLPPSLPLQPMRGPWWRVVLCVLHTCYLSPPILHPMMGLKNREEVGEVLAGWLSREDRLPRLALRKVNCRILVEVLINTYNYSVLSLFFNSISWLNPFEYQNKKANIFFAVVGMAPLLFPLAIWKEIRKGGSQFCCVNWRGKERSQVLQQEKKVRLLFYLHGAPLWIRAKPSPSTKASTYVMHKGD